MSIRIEREVFALPRAIEPQVEIFAIGDIHGRPDLLAALLDAASEAPRRAPRRSIEFIGADETIALMGNHETMMRLALDPATPPGAAIEALQTWIANGGDEVLM